MNHNYQHHDTATVAWMKHLKKINETGALVNIKGTQTKELLGASLIFDMRFPFIEHQHRFINKPFRAAEAYFITHGDNRTENLSRYMERYKIYSDDGYIMNGSYGPPFNEQLMYAVNTLRLDPMSRQAVISIWKPNPVESKDIRCTLNMQFIIRDGYLNTIVNMRSSDAIHGLSYDTFVFTAMTLRVLTLLNAKREAGSFLDLGNMQINMGSAHIYEYHYEEARKCADESHGNEAFTRIPDLWKVGWTEFCSWLHNEMAKGH